MLKQLGLTGFGIVSSFLCRRVQPLKEREHLGFEYSGAEDPSRMVLALELTDEEVLECLQKMLKGASIVPPIVSKFSTNNPPLAVSCFPLVRVLYVFLLYPFLFNFSSSCCFILFCRNLGATLLTRSLLMFSLPWRTLGRNLLGLLQPVSSQSPQCFLGFLPDLLMYMKNMFLV